MTTQEQNTESLKKLIDKMAETAKELEKETFYKDYCPECGQGVPQCSRCGRPKKVWW